MTRPAVQEHATPSAPRADVDEVDLALINALQLDPRVSWTTVGPVLGIDAATARRRWKRLTDAGLAWIAVHPGGPQLPGLVEVTCSAGHGAAVAEALAAMPQAVHVERITGGRDLMVGVAVPDLAALDRLVVGRIATLEGVRDTRTQLVTRPFVVGGDWQVGALDAQQRAQLPTQVPALPGTDAALDETERRIATLLAQDGRMSLTDIAGQLGCSVSTACRRVQAMIARRAVVLRCDLAQSVSGTANALWLWCRVPPDELMATGQRIAAMPQTRGLYAVTGDTASLMVCAWLHTLADGPRLESLLAAEAPGLTVIDRAVVLGSVKRMGG